MPKADTSILNIPEMVRLYFELDKAGAGLESSIEDEKKNASELSAIRHEMTDLENRIVATCPTTRAELAAKRRFIRKIKFITDDGRFDTGDLGELVNTILEGTIRAESLRR